MSTPQFLDAIVSAAARITPAAERADFLDAVCRGEAMLREAAEQQLVELLKRHEEASPSDGNSRTVSYVAAESERPGAQVGAYKLLEEIGHGGMGIVFLAEQKVPVKRRVALKIIKPGMDSRQIIARFESERQALSMMDHPNIARVLDAGTTDRGRPYFVMELVNGVPITQYCDEQHLTPRERLELFMLVCHAVQHAHQKGIIHRDLKPSNVLVALYDGRPVPKVIDFGVAKATAQSLTAHTVFTQLGQIVGTLEYMSPEQAQRNQLDVDTRSDVYSLGVLLYELLTGETPLDRRRLRAAAWDELLRIIREEEPVLPSMRLSSSQSLSSIAANRKIEPKKLSMLVRGELDWIVMRSLEKDRARRYESANALAADVSRYLNDEDVLACPPSASYRIRKFVRRHKAGVALASLGLLASLIAVAGLAFSNHIIAQERDAKNAALDQKTNALAEKSAALAAANHAEQEQLRLRLVAERQSALAESRQRDAELQRRHAEKNFQTARHAVDRLFTRVAADLQDQPYMEAVRRKLLEEAASFYQGFLRERADDTGLKFETAQAYRRVADICALLGEWGKCLESQQKSDQLVEQLLMEFPDRLECRAQLAEGRYNLAESLQRLARPVEARATLNDGIAKWNALLAEQGRRPEYVEQLMWLKVLARTQFQFGLDDWPRFIALGKESQELIEELKIKHPEYSFSQGRVGIVSNYSVWDLPKDREKLRGLEQYFRERLQIASQEASEHPDVPGYQTALAGLLGTVCAVLSAQEQFEAIEPLERQRMSIYERLVAKYPGEKRFLNALQRSYFTKGLLLYQLGREAESRSCFQQCMKLLVPGGEGEIASLQSDKAVLAILLFCPFADLRDPDNALQIALAHGDSGEKIVALVNAQRYRSAMEMCQSEVAKHARGEYKNQFFPDVLAPIFKMIEGYCRWQTGDRERGLSQYLAAKREFDDSTLNHYWFSLEHRLKVREFEREMGLLETNPH